MAVSWSPTVRTPNGAFAGSNSTFRRKWVSSCGVSEETSDQRGHRVVAGSKELFDPLRFAANVLGICASR